MASMTTLLKTRNDIFHFFDSRVIGIPLPSMGRSSVASLPRWIFSDEPDQPLERREVIRSAGYAFIQVP